MRPTQAIVLVLCTATTLVAYWVARDQSEQRIQVAFEALTEDSRGAAVNLLDSYLHALHGMAGFLDASEDVQNAEWRSYVETLDLTTNMPGDLGIGYIVPVRRDGLDTFMEEVVADGITDLVIHPDTGADDLFIIKYIEPIELNAPARGLDIAFEIGRRTAAEQSRDTGTPRLTSPIQLVQGGERPTGLLLLRPHYDPDMLVGTVEERRAAHQGWIYSPIITGPAMADLTSNQGELFYLRIADADVPGDAGVIYDTADTSGVAAMGTHLVQQTVPVFGREWTLTWQSTTAFDRDLQQNSNWAVLLTGAALTLLLYLFFRQNNAQGDTVARLVDKRTRELLAREDQNRSIVENAVFAILLLDDGDRIVSANAAAAALFGYGADDLLGKPLKALLPDLSGGAGTLDGLAHGVTADGARLHLGLQQNEWTNAEGASRRTLLMRDLTEETRSSNALRENERRWNLALQGANIGVFDIDLVQGVSVVSDTWRRLMGIDATDTIHDSQKHFLSRLHPDDAPVLMAADRDCIAGVTERSISEYRIRFGDNTWRWMHSDAVIVERDAEGRALRMVGAQTDVTALRQAQDALRHSDERFRLVLDNAPVGMAVTDREGRFQHSNGAIQALTGYGADELDGMPLASLFEGEDATSLLQRTADLGETSNLTYGGEHRIVPKNGPLRWGLVKVSCAFDSHKQEPIYIVQIHDITRQRELDSAKNEFVATVSHELRTPLTSIKGALGLIAALPDDGRSASEKRLLEIATINTDRLVHLVNDILDIEKISSGQTDFRMVEADPGDLARSAVHAIMPFAERLGVQIEIEDQEDTGPVHADLRRAEQVLSNLLSNACKFSPAGGIVTLRIHAEAKVVRFEVTDTGSGVPKNFRDAIFQPFSQADSSDTRQKGGTGLGLNIAKQIVERHGGTIGFESDEGQPTTFWFTLLRANREKAVVGAEKQAPLTGDAAQKHVLHLEDDADFAEVLHAALVGEMDIETVGTLAAARVELSRRKFDLVLIDWTLSDGDAADLLDEIDETQPAARVVGLSSHDRQDVGGRVDATLVKSRHDLDEVANEIRSQLLKAS